MTLPGGIYFQAHRGAGREAPENTLVAFRYTWAMGGIPEMDVRTTRDNVMICLHDETLARTTNADDTMRDVPVYDLTFEQIRHWDAGIECKHHFPDVRVPALDEVFADMKGQPERLVYLDLKKLDLQELARMIREYGVARQIIFCHNVQDNCIQLRKMVPGIRTMLWIGGKAEDIRKKFDQALATNFQGLDQVQLHLHPLKDGPSIHYALDTDYLKKALGITREHQRDLEVLPFEFDTHSLYTLLSLGIKWYATDEPTRFVSLVKKWAETA